MQLAINRQAAIINPVPKETDKMPVIEDPATTPSEKNA